MKKISRPTTAIAVCAVAVFICSSCISDTQGDRFYKTQWKSDEMPLGPFDINSLTLEFLSNGSVSISLSHEDSTTNTFGTYDADELNAVFHNLSVTIQDHEITFIEAHSSGSGSSNTLFLLWRIEDSVYPFTTALHRFPPYDQSLPKGME